MPPHPGQDIHKDNDEDGFVWKFDIECLLVVRRTLAGQSYQRQMWMAEDIDSLQRRKLQPTNVVIRTGRLERTASSSFNDNNVISVDNEDIKETPRITNEVQ